MASTNVYCIFHNVSMHNVLYFSLSTFTLYSPCFFFCVNDHNQKQTLLIKRFNFALIEDRPSVSQSNIKSATAEMKSNIPWVTIICIKLKLLFFSFWGLLWGRCSWNLKRKQLKDTCNGVIFKEFFEILRTFIILKIIQ